MTKLSSNLSGAFGTVAHCVLEVLSLLVSKKPCFRTLPNSLALPTLSPLPHSSTCPDFLKLTGAGVHFLDFFFSFL